MPQTFPFQKQVVREIEAFGFRSLAAIFMGGGKTRIALHALRRADAWPAAVVCPASVKWHWEREAMAVVGVRASVLEGQRPMKFSRGNPPRLVIVNYDILPFWLEWLGRLGIQAAVLDESQLLGSRRTRRTRAVQELCRGVPRVLALSGTPLLNRPAELWPTLNVVRPDKFPSFYSFAHKFCGAKRGPFGWDFKGSSNLDELNRILVENLMIRRTKDEVEHELPPKIHETVPLPLSRPEEYAEARDDFLIWLGKQGGGKLKAARRAAGITKIGYLIRLASRLKLRAVVEWVNNWLDESGDEKLVLFACHRKVLEVLRNRCNTKSVTVDGGVPARKRKLAVAEFQHDKACRLFLGNILAAGTGTDGLQRASSSVAVVERPWRPGDVLQAEDRIHRIGQEKTAFVYNLVAAGTVEEDLCRVLAKKQRVLAQTLDGAAAGADVDVFDSLVLALEGGFLPRRTA